ncbi:MAG TPA: S26 family signal peptidase, partial [Isosphaeraceae bacterium]|nr:S26 family signal peptidase [Isosphaeraceae bacterium]
MTRTLDKNAKKPAPATDASGRKPARSSHRDFFEQVAIAFIAAFLVRVFSAEAFVIPTGSMAPTLMGMHKELDCPYCGFTFATNVSEMAGDPNVFGRLQPRFAVCANCRAPVPVSDEPVFNGDRILVLKYMNEWPLLKPIRPERWTVVVFHYPEEPETNYIKRMVGLPEESLRLYFGDVLTRPSGTDEPHRYERRPLRHQQAMQINVWDDRYPCSLIADRPEWRRWTSEAEENAKAPSWAHNEASHYAIKAGADWSVLRYRHLVPDLPQWRSLLQGEDLPYPPQPSLVSDFYAYNSGAPDEYRTVSFAPCWVGDLTLSATVEAKSDTGAIRLELVEAGVTNRCEIDLKTGLAVMSHGDTVLGKPVPTSVKGSGTYDLRLANVDGRLTLWVDEELPFGEGVSYEDGSEFENGGHPLPTAADLKPAAVSARGAEVEVSDLVLTRDIYYTEDPNNWDYDGTGLARTTTLS